MNNIFVSCGEVSGDLYAADFIAALLARKPELRGQVWGMMGPKAMAACGDWCLGGGGGSVSPEL